MSRISLDARFYTLDPNNTNYMKKVTFFFYEKKNMSHSHLSGSGHWWRNDGVLGANLNSTKKLGGANKYLSFQAFFSWWGKTGLSPVAATIIDIFSYFFYTMFFIVWATYFYDLFKSATFLKGNSETVQICPTPVHICPTLFIFLNIKKKANKANYHVFERNPVYTWDLPLFDSHCVFCKVSHSDIWGQYEKKVFIFAPPHYSKGSEN